MSQNEPISAKQLNIIELLIAGDSVTNVAESTGVGRSSIHRWMREDPFFQAGLNLARQERFVRHARTLEEIAASAVDNVRRAIVDEGDLKTSLIVLDKLGLLVPHSVGATDPEDILTDHIQAESQRASDRSQAELVKAFS